MVASISTRRLTAYAIFLLSLWFAAMICLYAGIKLLRLDVVELWGLPYHVARLAATALLLISCITVAYIGVIAWRRTGKTRLGCIGLAVLCMMVLAAIGIGHFRAVITIMRDVRTTGLWADRAITREQAGSIAVGMSYTDVLRVLGFRYPENIRSPYDANCVTFIHAYPGKDGGFYYFMYGPWAIVDIRAGKQFRDATSITSNSALSSQPVIMPRGHASTPTGRTSSSAACTGILAE